MTKNEIELLKALIAADRTYRTKAMRGELVHRNERGVEVSKWFGNTAAAKALQEAGLAEILDPGINSNPWIFLGNYNPYDPE